MRGWIDAHSFGIRGTVGLATTVFYIITSAARFIADLAASNDKIWYRVGQDSNVRMKKLQPACH